MTIKIEKRVPIPENKRGKPNKYPFPDMKIGDSFLFTENLKDKRKSIQHASAAANTWKKVTASKFKFSCRLVKNGVRIWRIA